MSARGSACIITVVHQPLDVRIFQKQARTLAQNGWEVTLIAPCDESEQTVDGVRILGLPRAPRWRRPLNWARALRLAVGTNADIYHIHDPELLLLTPLIRLWTRRPVIYDVHEDYRLSIFEKSWIPRALRHASTALFDLGERLLLKSTSAVVYVTPPIGLRYVSAGGTSVQIANYAMRSQYADDPEEERDRGAIVCVGGMTRIRGYDELFDAFALVVRELPEARLVLVGSADGEDYGAHLRSKAERLGVAEAVVFAGKLPFEEVRRVLASASAGALPYLPVPAHEVAFPTKLFEYMAAGLPCVCSDIPLCREIVENAGCGIIVDARDASATAKAILYLLQHPAEAQEMGRRGREAFLAHYTWEQEGEKLVALYQQLAGGQRQQGGESNPAVR